MPEATLRIFGDVFEGLVEGQPHAPEIPDRLPSIAVAPPEDFEEVSRLQRADARDGGAAVLAEEGVAPGVLADRDAAPLRFVESLDPSLGQVERHSSMAW